MSDTPIDQRTFDAADVAMILREAANIEPPLALSATAGGDGFTLRQIEQAASEVGITLAAVTTAALRVTLRDAHLRAVQFQHTHELAGELDAIAWDALESHIRTVAVSADLHRTDDGIDFELGKSGGELGLLRVQIRSTRGTTTIAFWSVAPELSGADLLGYAIIGVPPTLFPVVAAAGGRWPGVGWIAALLAAGGAAGAGLGIALQRWKINRWRKRLAGVLMPVAQRVGELVRQSEARS